MLDIVSFTIWPSVEFFLGELDPILYFEKDWRDIWLSAWGVRTGVAIPSLLLAEWTPLSQDESFALFCGLWLSGTCLVINRTAVTCFGTRLTSHELLVSAVILGIGYFMNGRLCPAFLGSALIMRAHLYWISNQMSTSRALIYNSISLPLMTVSSGTFMVGLATVVLWLAFAVFDRRRGQVALRFRPIVLLGSLPVLYIALVQASQFTNKLFEFYQGDIVQVLYHGYGEILQDFLPGLTLEAILGLTVAALPLAFICVVLVTRSLSLTYRYLFFSTAITICLGACGYSTMFTNTPTVVLCCALFLYRPRRVPALTPVRITRMAA
jgi:hypothetical protein